MKFRPFYPLQEKERRDKYSKLLSGIAQVSKIYSDSKKPYLHYRVAENIFCKCFSAKDVSRKDCSVDAVKKKDGIGIKTFVSNGVSKYEKIAEFDDRTKYPLTYGNHIKLAKQVACYRNERLSSTAETYEFDNALYHYLIRSIGKILICECPMLPINEKLIVLESKFSKRNVIRFKDNFFSYSFNLSKHTLFQSFITNVPLEIVKVPSRIDDKLMLETIKELTGEKEGLEASLLDSKEYVVLPLYSTRTGGVPEKSGLNQWNAGGRERDYDEVYIPIPRIVYEKKPGFFPPRNKKFTLKTQNGKEFSAKVCQENGKALMTDPNKDLGKWLLRNMLGLKKGELASLEFLRKKNADTVIIYKLKEGIYQISLHSFGGFEKEYR
jgi:hypothetical protein